MVKRIGLLFSVIALVILVGCSHSNTSTMMTKNDPQPMNGEAKILQSWQGDYPVARLDLLPDKQCEIAAGYFGNAKTFEAVWSVFKSGEAVPNVDFNVNLVVFARNTQFFNRNKIFKVKVTNGVAEVLAMETRSAMPIEDKVAMSLAVVARQGISAIKNGGGIISVDKP